MNSSRVMISAASSGSGKTTITLGIISALKRKNLKVSSFKCGPDYIDPMFHTKVAKIKSKNIDSFFMDDNTIKYLMSDYSKDTDISIIEGVMGYYDGIKGTSTKASSYDIAKITDTPVILIVNARGMMRSIMPILKGFIEYKKDSNIKGVILNRISKMSYILMKEMIENELKLKVFGYVEEMKDIKLESRHLGLITPSEIDDFNKKLDIFTDRIVKTVDIHGILNLSKSVNNLTYNEGAIKSKIQIALDSRVSKQKVKIAVAMDRAFCFYYEDNLNLLRKMGAEIVYFSPLCDNLLPDKISGIILGGGYPEIYAKRLSQNKKIINDLKEKIEMGMPVIAECGGFMYLLESIEGAHHERYNMAGIFHGNSFNTGKLKRFGYITLTANEDNILCKKGESIKAHEFHYFDSTQNGNTFKALKPLSSRKWQCMNTYKNVIAGYPHMHFYSNIDFAGNFINKCFEYHKKVLGE